MKEWNRFKYFFRYRPVFRRKNKVFAAKDAKVSAKVAMG